MNLDNYSTQTLDDIYVEDIPYILKPHWAMNYIESANKEELRSCFAFCSRTVVSDIESGQTVLVRNRYSGTEIFGVIGFDGQPSNDLPLFLWGRLRRVIEGQLTRPYFTVSAPKMAEVEFESSTLDDGLSQHEKQRKQNHKDNAAAYADVQARSAKKPIEVPSFSIEDTLDNPELQGISSVNIDPVSMLVERIEEVIHSGKAFLDDPSLKGIATTAISAVLGKMADKIVDAVPEKIIPEKVIRQDDNFELEINRKGHRKSHIKNGMLIPANPNGDISIQQHIRGSEPKKSNSQYTSTSAIDGNSGVKFFGENQIVIDTNELQKDISKGVVKGVEIISPIHVQKELSLAIKKADEKYIENPSNKNLVRLERAKSDLSNVKRDNECLIKGCIPEKYIKVGNHE